MKELLRIGCDEGQDQPWPRVHALNTLRLAFGDKTLASDASGFFAQGVFCLSGRLCDCQPAAWARFKPSSTHAMHCSVLIH